MTQWASATGSGTTTPVWVVPLIAAVFGMIGGAISNLAIGPKKAEREERGKRRIEARRDVAAAVRTFRYALSESRLNRYAGETVNGPDVMKAAALFSVAVQACQPILPALERRRLRKRAARIVGPAMLAMASLRPFDAPNLMGDSAILDATALHRQGSKGSLFSESLLRQPPTALQWDRAIEALDRLRQRYG